MANRFFARALIVCVFAVLSSSGCERSPASPSTFTSPPSTPTQTSTPPQPAALTVSALSPAVGLIGDVVRVMGTGFVAGATVTLDGKPARVTNTTSAFIVAITPAHPVGEVDVSVTNPDGQSSTLARGFAYEIVMLKASADTIAAGAEPLTVSWTAPKGRPLWDWVALIKVGESTGTYAKGWWEYTGGAALGALTMSAPAEPERYEFRYMLDDGFTEAARSSPVTVRPSASPSLRVDLARER